RGSSSRSSIGMAIDLSPLDPFLYAMQATRGFSYLIEEDYESAAEWAERGALGPGAHYLIGAIAVAAHELNGNHDKATRWLEQIRIRREDVSREHFFTAFPFSNEDVKERISQALKSAGL
ncbi:MAG: transcriptional regulator, partial [Verrucomicrobiota bacterium]